MVGSPIGALPSGKLIVLSRERSGFLHQNDSFDGGRTWTPTTCDYDGQNVQIWGQAVGTTEDTWAVAQAKARFSELIERALSDGPRTITRHGRTAVVVVSAEEWERKHRRRGNLAEFFATSPLPGSGLDLERTHNLPREIEL